MKCTWKRGNPRPTMEQQVDQAKFLLDLILRYPGLNHPIRGSPEVLESCRVHRTLLGLAWEEWNTKEVKL